MASSDAERKHGRRSSIALGPVKICTLEDLQELDTSEMEPIRVLVTVHSMAPCFGNIYVKGLGMWVGYIVQKYLKIRKIPHRLYMKSILTHGCRRTKPETVVKFLQRNKIDILIPSDVTDTQFLAQHYALISPVVKMAVTNDLGVYEMLEDKWDTFNMCQKYGIATPHTEKFDYNKEKQDFPFFLKVASGTNAGRGVWNCKDDNDLKKALAAKEAKGKDVLLLAQKPTMGEVICAEIIYQNGHPVGFFFAKSVQAEDLAGMGTKYVLSQSDDYKQQYSHEKVELEDEQWEAVTKIFLQIGKATKYHGMIDIEFIVAGEGNPGVEKGSVWLLECNPRFSGDIHTTLSNPGFLDIYFDVVNNKEIPAGTVGNYSVGVEMQSSLGNFYPANFYVEHPFHAISIRHWNVDNYHSYNPNKGVDSSQAASKSPSQADKEDDYPKFDKKD